MTIIFPHIPKCGGTSILRALQRSGKRCFLDYDHPPSHIKFFELACLRRNDEFQLLDFSPFDVVYGHFPIVRYNVSPDHIVLLLREPVERAISNFFYYKDVLPISNTIGITQSPEILEIKSGALGITGFVKKLKVFDTYKNYVGRVDTRSFRLVGFTDQISDFVERLKSATGIDLGAVGTERMNPSKDTTDVDRAALTELLADEIDWYTQQRDAWAR